MSAPDEVIAQSLTDASVHHGFMLLVNHGVDVHAERAAVLVEQRLTSSSTEELEGWRRQRPGYGPGLQHSNHRPRRRTLEGEYYALAREDFVFVSPRDRVRKAAGDEHYTRKAAEIWYGDVEPLCPDHETCIAFSRYYSMVESLSLRLQRLFALAVTRDPNAWTRHFEHHKSNLVAAFHRADEGSNQADDGSNQTEGRHDRVAAHSDANLFTLIHYGGGAADGAGGTASGADGLEIFDRGCEGWMRVGSEQIEGQRRAAGGKALLLNLGDEMAWLSNGRFLSTPHRVVDRTAEGTPVGRRLALIFFYAAAYDALLVPHVSAGDRPKFEPLLVGRHTYNFRTAPAAQQHTFDEWARSVGLLASGDEHGTALHMAKEEL